MNSLSPEQMTSVEKIVEAEVERRMAAVETTLALAVQAGLDKLKHGEVTLPPQIITGTGEQAEAGTKLVKVIEDQIAAKMDRVLGPWLKFAGLLAALLAAGVVLLQFYLNARKEADGAVAESKAAAHSSRMIAELVPIKARFDEKARDVDVAVAAAKVQIESWERRRADTESALKRSVENHDTAAAQAAAAREELEKAVSEVQRAHFTLAPTIQRMLEVIAQHPESKNVLDLQGVPVGGVVVLNAQESRQIEQAQSKQGRPSWCLAQGQSVVG